MIGVRVYMNSIGLEAEIARTDTALLPSNLAAFLKSGGVEIMQERARNRFAVEGDDASGKWRELRWSTQAIRANQGYGAASPINVREGDLREFVLENTGEHRSTTFTASMGWPAKAPQGPLGRKYRGAQRGTKRGEARPVVAANGEDLVLLLSGVAHWIAASSNVEIR